jgi:dTDP-4-amino-4,6-dideoxygalactose transaminase
LVTNDAGLAARADVLRNHGASISEEQRHHGPQPYLLASFDELGFNYRMTDIQAAIGAVQLAKLDSFIDERHRWASFYREQLADIEWLRQPSVPNHGRHAWQAYVTYVDPGVAPMPRNEIMARLHAMGVATRPGTHAVHMLSYYKERLGYGIDDLPGARDCERNTMAIPLHNRMTEEDYAYVADCLQKIAGRA